MEQGEFGDSLPNIEALQRAVEAALDAASALIKSTTIDPYQNPGKIQDPEEFGARSQEVLKTTVAELNKLIIVMRLNITNELEFDSSKTFRTVSDMHRDYSEYIRKLTDRLERMKTVTGQRALVMGQNHARYTSTSDRHQRLLDRRKEVATQTRNPISKFLGRGGR